MTDLIAGCFCVRACLLGNLCSVVLSALYHFSPDNRVNSRAGFDTEASFCIPHIAPNSIRFSINFEQFAQLMVRVLYTIQCLCQVIPIKVR